MGIPKGIDEGFSVSGLGWYSGGGEGSARGREMREGMVPDGLDDFV